MKSEQSEHSSKVMLYPQREAEELCKISSSYPRPLGLAAMNQGCPPKDIAKTSTKANMSNTNSPPRSLLSTMEPQTPEKLSPRLLMLRSAQETLLEMVRRGENERVIQIHNEIIREMLQHKSRPSRSSSSNSPSLIRKRGRSPSKSERGRKRRSPSTDSESMFANAEDKRIDVVSLSDGSTQMEGSVVKKTRGTTVAEKKSEGEKRDAEKTADKKGADKKGVDKKGADKKAADKKAADKKIIDKKAGDKKAAEQKAAEKMAADKKNTEGTKNSVKTCAKSFTDTSKASQTPDMKTAHAASQPQAQLPAGMRSDPKIDLDKISKTKVHTTFDQAKTNHINRHSRVINSTNKSRSPFRVPRRALEQIIRTPTPSPPPSLASSYHPISMENLAKYQASVEDAFDEDFESYQRRNGDYLN